MSAPWLGTVAAHFGPLFWHCDMIAHAPSFPSQASGRLHRSPSAGATHLSTPARPWVTPSVPLSPTIPTPTPVGQHPYLTKAASRCWFQMPRASPPRRARERASGTGGRSRRAPPQCRLSLCRPGVWRPGGRARGGGRAGGAGGGGSRSATSPRRVTGRPGVGGASAGGVGAAGAAGGVAAGGVGEMHRGHLLLTRAERKRGWVGNQRSRTRGVRRRLWCG